MYTPVQHGREANIAHDRNTNDWIHDSNWNLQSESMNDEQFYHYPYQQMYCKSRMNTITTISSRKVHIHNHGHEHLHPWKTKTVTYTPILRYSDKLHVFPFCGGYYPQSNISLMSRWLPMDKQWWTSWFSMASSPISRGCHFHRSTFLKKKGGLRSSRDFPFE